MHNKKTSMKSTAPKQSKSSYSRRVSYDKTGELADYIDNGKRTITESDIKKAQKNIKHKKKYVFTQQVKQIGVIAVCIIMVLAFAIPSAILAFTPQQQAQDGQAEDISIGISRKAKQSLDDLGKFDQFLIVDYDKGITLTDLYDDYVTPDEQAILDELDEKNMPGASKVLTPKYGYGLTLPLYMPSSLTDSDDETTSEETGEETTENSNEEKTEESEGTDDSSENTDNANISGETEEQ